MHRLPVRRLRASREGAHRWSRRRTRVGCGGRHFIKKSYRCLAATGRLGMFGISSAATGKQRSIPAFLKTVATMPWLQFNPLSLMNENKGVFGVNLGHLWNEGARVRGWHEKLIEKYTQGAYPASNRQAICVPRRRRGTPLHPKPPEHWQGATDALTVPNATIQAAVDGLKPPPPRGSYHVTSTWRL